LSHGQPCSQCKRPERPHGTRLARSPRNCNHQPRPPSSNSWHVCPKSSRPPCSLHPPISMQYQYTHPAKSQKLPDTPRKCPSRFHPSSIDDTLNAASTQSLPQAPHPFLNPKPRVRLPQLFHLGVRQFLVHFLHVYQFFDGEDLTRYVGRDGVVDGAHALVQAEGFEHAAGFAR
jgi:hypothetical protein